MRRGRLAAAALALAAAAVGGACTQDERTDLAQRPGAAIGRASETAFCTAIRNNADDRADELARGLATVAPEAVRDDLRAFAENGDQAARERARSYVRERCGDAAADRL